MKFILSLLTAAFISAPAMSADMPVKSPFVAPAAATTWQGMYLGLNGGWNLGSFNPIFGTGVDATSVNLDDNSPFVGGHIGYVVQNGSFVAGPEFGVQWWGFKSQAEVMPATVTAPAVLLQQKIDWLAYANVRGGFAVTPGILAYVTGGAAWAHIKGQLINIADLNTVNEQSVLGWNIGAGLEFKLTEYLTFGGEYRHYDFGKVSGLNPALAIELGGVMDKLTVDQAMARLSYRLN